MLNAFRALREGQVPDAVHPWLFAIARNAAASTTRRRRVLQLEIDSDLPVLESPAQTVVDRERVGHLLNDLAEMPSRRRRVLLMRAVQGLGYEEIGEELGMSPAAARQAAREARVSLDQAALGRDLHCRDVSAVLELGDARSARSRAFLSHLRACADCRRLLPRGSATRGQVAALLASVLAIRVAAAKALASSGQTFASLASAGMAAKTTSVVAIAITAGSAVVAGLGERPGGRTEPPPREALRNSNQPARVVGARAAAAQQAGGRPTDLVAAESGPLSAAEEVTTEPAAGEPRSEEAGAALPGVGGGSTSDLPTDAQEQRDTGNIGHEHSTQGAASARGASESAPGHGGNPRAQRDAAGQSGDAPGASGSAPGHGGTPPGHDGTAGPVRRRARGERISAGPRRHSAGQDGTPPGPRDAARPVRRRARCE